MTRALKINLKDGSHITLKLSKAARINYDAGMLHVDKLKDKSWRLTYSRDILDDFSIVDNIEVVRED